MVHQRGQFTTDNQLKHVIVTK